MSKKVRKERELIWRSSVEAEMNGERQAGIEDGESSVCEVQANLLRLFRNVK